MTDKHIKDYCKNCDVEPPAMKFKCPKCEHNPDNENFAKDINVPSKEQIMIDGIDVSKCKYYDKDCFWHCMHPDTDSYKCKENTDCDYKQLTRKTKECEELKNNLHIANTNHEAAEQECDRYLKAFKEIEEYSNTYFDKEVSKEIFDIINKAKEENNENT